MPFMGDRLFRLISPPIFCRRWRQSAVLPQPQSARLPFMGRSLVSADFTADFMSPLATIGRSPAASIGATALHGQIACFG